MRIGKLSHEEVFDGEIPSLASAQFQERYYPDARVVPIIIPQDEALYRPSGEPGDGIFYGPSQSHDMWQYRWETKGAPETRALLGKVSRKTGCRVAYVTGRPLRESLDAKRGAAIVIDELVNGSYHTTTLEGLSVGRAVVTYLDPRVRRVMAEMAGTEHCPVVSAHLDEALDVLLHLVDHPEETAEVGAAARRWFEHYWADHIQVRHFEEVYGALADDPEKVSRQEALRLDGTAGRFLSIALPDRIHEARCRIHWRSIGPVGRARARLRHGVHYVKTYLMRFPAVRRLRNRVYQMFGKP